MDGDSWDYLIVNAMTKAGAGCGIEDGRQDDDNIAPGEGRWRCGVSDITSQPVRSVINATGPMSGCAIIWRCSATWDG